MSTPAHLLGREPAVEAGSLQPVLPSPAAPSLADARELAVLSAVIGRCEPLTLRRICVLTGLGPLEARAALDGLRTAGVVHRLNTVVESYLARS